MADPTGITYALIISSIVAGAGAAVSYSEARTANRRAVAAAEQRNEQLKDVYAAEGAQQSKKAQREQRRLAIERHMAQDSLAASVASSGIITTTGSAATGAELIGANYGQAAAELAGEAQAQQRAGMMNFKMAQSDTYNTLAQNYRNPLMEGFQTGASLFSMTMGTFASGYQLANMGSAPTGAPAG